MPTVDSLDIQISAQASKASASIDRLVGKLNTLSSSLSRINGNGLTGLANGVQKLGNSMQVMNTVKTADFTRLANNLTKLSTIDTASINKAASSVTAIGKSFNNIGNLSKSAEQLGQLANGIKQLGYTSATKAIQNIPKLATAMKTLMGELSGVPRVSQNLIDMTNALAKLARTGSSSGRAADSLSRSFTNLSASGIRTSSILRGMQNNFRNLFRSILPFVGAMQLINFGKQAMEISSNLTEVQNVVDVTFAQFKDRIEDFADTSIQDFGMSELTAKTIASRFQAMGVAMGFARGEMADMSVNLTALAGDMASFYNVAQEDMAKSLQAIFTGETEPLRRYGIDLTNATLQEWAMKQGLDANIQSMTQAEKTLMRYNYVLANTVDAQGDFARTANSWANSIRVLKQNFEALGAIVGQVLINVFKPFVQALNSVMQKVIQFARVVANALGKIFGWKLEINTTGITDDIGGIADYADQAAGGLESGSDAAKDEADNINKAQKAAKKLRDFALRIDELNIIRPDDVDALDDITNNLDKINKPSVGTGGTGTGGGGGGDVASSLTKTDSILKEFESEIDTLYELGEYIRDSLIGAMESIDWESVYEKARGFGKGLAEFLNGLLSYDGEGRTLFGVVGKTLANTLNTVVYSALEFAKEFDFYQFGVNLNDAIKQFFGNFDFSALAEALNLWVDGLKETIKGLFSDPEAFKNVFDGLKELFSELELDTISVIVGIMTIKKLGGISFAAGALKGIGKKAGAKLGTAIMAGLSFKGIGKLLLKLFPSSVLISTITTTMAETGASLPAVLSQTIITPLSTFFKGALTKVFSWTPHLAVFAGIIGVGNEIIQAMKERFDTSEWSFGDWIANTLSTSFSGIKGELENLAISLELWWQDTWLSNAIWNFGQWWSEKIAPWFTQEKWTELFNNILLGLQTKWTEIIEWWNSTGFGIWFNENVAPYFSETDWTNMYSIMDSALQAVWGNLVKWWEETAIYKWWNDDVKPWFELEKWTELFDIIKTSLNNVWDDVVSWWKNTAIYRWYNDNVKPWFSEDRWTFSGIKEGLVKAWNNAIDAIKGIWNKFANWINKALTFSFDGLELPNGEKIASFEVSLGKIPTFQTGGFPDSGDFFFANENGIPELVGTIGGRTAVASGTEITGISNAVYSTGETQASLLSTAVELLRIIAEKDPSVSIDGRELVSAYNERNKRNGYPFSK